MPDMNTSFDVIVIGGGPGGSRTAKVLAQAGKKVALISDDLGGECLNYGCIPTKTYLWTAELFEKISASATFGIDVSSATINWEKLKQRKNDVVSRLKKGLKFTLDRAGVQIIEGRAKLLSSTTVEITGQAPASAGWVSSGQSEPLQATQIILATGSEPVFPSGFEASEKILSNKQILDLPSPPKTLLIIGGGVIGVEFASVFSAMGTKITIAEHADRLLLHEDAEISAELERVFSRRGITILKNARVEPNQIGDFEYVLVATGRRPKTSGLGLELAGIAVEKSGIKTNEFYQTNVPNIFAIGDLAGRALLAYTAEREGEIAAQKILGGTPKPLNYEIVPNTIFSIPEVASVGLNEEKAKAAGIDYVAGKALMSSSAKALILGNRDGFAKILAHRQTHKILGIHIIGEKATELIAEASLALSQNLTLKDFTENLHSHPILGEVVKDACETVQNMLK